MLVLEDSMYLQLIYFLNTIPFWFAERFFSEWWDTYIR